MFLLQAFYVIVGRNSAEARVFFLTMACNTGASVAEQAVDPTIRYDRQTRLWGQHAQRRLMAANVCLVNASAAGTEALKNVVLPGFKKFTILDSCEVDDTDLGTNFFVTAESKGQSRAKEVSALLQELNPLVEGAFVNEVWSEE